MKHAGSLRTIAAAAITVTVAGTGPAAAAPAHNVCIPRASGVPTREGPPKWLDWSSSTKPTDTALDDPRWLGATAQSFELGAARAPLHARALWATEGGKTYMYMSFVVDLEGFELDAETTPRDLFLGFRRQTAFAGAGGTEKGYIFQFHIAQAGGPGVVIPEHCTDYDTCSESPGPGRNYWRAFVDRGATNDTCTAAGVTVNGPKYEAFLGGGPNGEPITWMTHPAAGASEDAVRFWKLDATQPPLLQNRWAVQIRLPVAATGTESLEAGIPSDATFWYQATAKLSGPGGNYAKIGWWPREVPGSICVKAVTPAALVHPNLGDTPACAACSLDNFSSLTRFAGARPATCDGGITIRSQNIGAIFNAPGGTDFTSAPLTNTFRAGQDGAGNDLPNTVVAQIVNTTNADINSHFLARFRLASWGAAPWSTADTGKWRDLRVAPNGACASGTLPTCGPATARIPRLVDANNDGQPDLGTNNRGAITVQWAIGSDATIGKSEYCQYGLTPPGGTCAACSCSGAPNCYAASDPGTRATVGATTFPCVSSVYRYDQCLLVELQAPNGGVVFEQQSAWNNMQFDQMSVVAREALIDARGLPAAPGQKYQDIYLVAMARNMPRSLPSGADGAMFIRERAITRAEKIAAPYVKDLAGLNAQQIAAIAQQLGRNPQNPVPELTVGDGPTSPTTHTHGTVSLGGALGEKVKNLARALVIMPDRDFLVVGKLLKVAVSNVQTAAELTEAFVKAVGHEEAAEIVPTLEIYPFYQHLGAGNVYTPMTAFTVFLSHQGAMSGMTWQIDGAKQVGLNTYRMQIPVGYAKKIQVRAQAIEGTELLAPGNPKWPCTGGCCGPRNCGLVGQVGNAWPGMIAAMFVILRRRRRRIAPQL